MKTIRTNCFETNSSSTHSVTIDTKVNREIVDVPALSENGVLYPARINDPTVRAAFHTSPKQGDWNSTRAWTFTATTKDTKTALLVHYIYSILEYETLDDDLLAEVLSTIASFAGYDSIDLGENFWTAYSIDRYGGDENNSPEFEKLLETIGYSISGNKVLVNLQALGLFVQNVVCDNDKALIDYSEEY